MKTVTITLDEKTAAWVRAYAAKHNTSVSRIIVETLQQRMGELHEYDQAMRRFMAKAPIKMNRAGKRYPGRDELHDRSRLR
jgi:sulfur relay (sulfurtransferase) DsrC/TusE family protein